MPAFVTQKSVRVFLVLSLTATLSACMTRNHAGNSLKTTQASPGFNTPFSARNQSSALKRGKSHFLNGDYGNAERYFRLATEKSPRDINAWIGLAASYDHLSRFKLAKRAYAQAMELGGKTPVLLNNIGYSYLLQGKLKKARQHFLMASRKAPGNLQIQNNLALTRASTNKVVQITGAKTKNS